MKHPENLKDVNSIEVNEALIEFITGVASDVDQADVDRGEWRARDDEYFRKRYGLRRKRVHPWPGAANFVMPLIDADITRVKPAYMNLVNVDPIVAFEPFGPEDIEPGRKREVLLDYRLKHKMNFMKPYLMGVDMAMQKGFTVFKVIWKFKSRKYTEFLDIAKFPQKVLEALYAVETTDGMLKKIVQEELDVDLDFEENLTAIEKAVGDFRSGVTKLELTLMEKENNEPELIVCDPKEDLVVPTDTCDIQDARWIDYKFFMTVNDLKIAMKDEKYHSFSNDDIASWAGKEGVKTFTGQFVKEGVNKTVISDDIVRLHETCVMYDIDGDGILEKCIATYPHASPMSILRMIELPYDHGHWPYIQVRRELTDPSFYSSRGIPALDDDFQTGISTLFNNDINNQTVVSTPYTVYRKNAVKNIRNLKYIPGQTVEVDDINAFEIRQHVNTSQSTFLNSQRLLKAWANERLGTPAGALSEQNNSEGGGQGGRRTAKEVGLISTIAGQNQAVELLVWQLQMAEVYYQIDALYEQFGPQEEFVMTGEEPQRMTRRQIQGKFNLVPNGTLDNSNPILRSQKTFLLFQAFRGDPDIKQDPLKKMVIQDVDPKLARLLLFSPEEKAQIQQQQQQAIAQAKVQALSEGIQTQRISTQLELEKEAGIELIHGRKFAPDGPKASSNGKGK